MFKRRVIRTIDPDTLYGKLWVWWMNNVRGIKPVFWRGYMKYANVQEDWRADYHDFGTIEGRLEAIQYRGDLQIRVRDPLLRGIVRCYLPDEMLADALSNFNNRVEVTGDIHYRKNGVPISITVARVEKLPDDIELPDADDVRGILRLQA